MDLQKKPMLAQYFRLKEQYKDSVLLFQVGNFYQMYFHDAKLAEEVLSLKLITRNVGGGQYIPMCGIPSSALPKRGEELAGKGYRVVVCDQKVGCTDEKGITVREVVQVIEPPGDRIDLTRDWDGYLQANPSTQQPYRKVDRPTATEPSPAASDALLQELSRLDLGMMTPFAALELLYEWKRKYLTAGV